MRLERQKLTTDVLVIGGGGAGLRAALAARQSGADVLLLSKMGSDAPNCTVRAWGGFTYAPPKQTGELFRQVVETGGHLSNQRLVEVFAAETPRRIAELSQVGVQLQVLDRADVRGCLGLTKIPGEGRTTGTGLTEPLRVAALAAGVRIRYETMACCLASADGGIAGAMATDLRDQSLLTVSAKSVVLATGGGACMYERTDNPDGTTGDGMALAYEAGAELVDMECVSFQFPASRLPELLAAGSAPREHLLALGTAHYFLGGVRIDECCRTNVPGLYAAGETTGGLFGAGRLGGSALADVIVFGAVAGEQGAAWAKTRERVPIPSAVVSRERERVARMLHGNGPYASGIAAELRALMWRGCGTMKTEASLRSVESGIAELAASAADPRAGSVAGLREAIECRNMLAVAALVCESSLLRAETRGCFWRLDFPEPDNAHWVRNIHLWREEGAGRIAVKPAVMTRLCSPNPPRIGAGCFGYT